MQVYIISFKIVKKNPIPPTLIGKLRKSFVELLLQEGIVRQSFLSVRKQITSAQKPALLSLILILSVALFLCAMPVHAETIISGGSVSGTWQASGSPYLIQGDINIPYGSELSVEGGTEIVFQGHYKLIVNGILNAVGAFNDSIRFTAANPDTGWHGIRFLSAQDSSRLAYCIIDNGRASGQGADMNGGGVYIYASNPIIERCTIRNNRADYAGGGIYVKENADPAIRYSEIIENLAQRHGGGINITVGSRPNIAHSVIGNNTSNHSGGGLSIGWGADALISHCRISGNTATVFGGGVDCDSAAPVIEYSSILNNVAGTMGGGFDCDYSDVQIRNCLIMGNRSNVYGGALDFWYSNPVINKCTIVSNSAAGYGSAVDIWFSGLTLENSIVAENSGFGGLYFVNSPNAGISHSDFYGNAGGNFVGSGIPAGMGILTTVNAKSDSCDNYYNIYLNPEFLDTSWGDYRLQWGSPCIDTGDENVIFTDPDNTVADMGAYYFDQSAPVSIRLSPHVNPIVLPASGGGFNSTIHIANIAPQAQMTTIWCNILLPNGSTYGPVIGPIALNLPAQFVTNRVRTQNVPGYAPPGDYQFSAFAVAAADTSQDSIPFLKLPSGLAGGGSSWWNTGDSFDDLPSVTNVISAPNEYLLEQNRPNPFNPATVISFQLPQSGRVQLEIYDLLGNRVASLLDRYLEAGRYEAEFNGANLTSGVYFYRLTAQSATMVRKMILVK